MRDPELRVKQKCVVLLLLLFLLRINVVVKSECELVDCC